MLLSCGGSESRPTSDVVAKVPWPAEENLSFVLKDKGGRTVGRGVLTVSAESDGRSRLSQRFTAGENSDETSVVVDAKTLRPISGQRVIVAPNQRDEIQTTYEGETARIKQGDKQTGLKLPENAYDNDTSLFVWRAIDFRDGYNGSYWTIITNRRSRQQVTIIVMGREQVTVPAGQFTAWKLQVETENARQTAWYADTPSRPLVRYDNDRGTIFELERLP